MACGTISIPASFCVPPGYLFHNKNEGVSCFHFPLNLIHNFWESYFHHEFQMLAKKFTPAWIYWCELWIQVLSWMQRCQEERSLTWPAFCSLQIFWPFRIISGDCSCSSGLTILNPFLAKWASLWKGLCVNGLIWLLSFWLKRASRGRPAPPLLWDVQTDLRCYNPWATQWWQITAGRVITFSKSMVFSVSTSVVTLGWFFFTWPLFPSV